MARLPKPGDDKGTWGDILNAFLLAEHQPNGKHNVAGMLEVPGAAGSLPVSDPAQSKGFAWQAVTKEMVGLADVDNTADADKPLSTPQKTYIDTQVATHMAADATVATKGKMRLRGDLGGTADHPVVKGRVRMPLAGVWHTNTPNPSGASLVAQVQSLESAAGCQFDLISAYASLATASFSADVQPILNAGYKCLYVLEPDMGGSAANLDTIILQLQAGVGGYVSALQAVFDAMAADGRSEDVILAMFHECNGPGNYPWQVYAGGGNTAAKLKQAYQLVVAFARSRGTRCKFAQVYQSQNPTNQYGSFASMYAGDAYIDYVGVTDYNRAGISYASWRYPGQLLRDAYYQFVEMSSRPVLIMECNSVPSTASNSRANWLRDYFAMAMSDEFSRIECVTVFSENKTSIGSANWYLSSPEDLQALAVGVRQFQFRGHSQSLQARHPINKNLLPYTICDSATGWNKFGPSTTVVSDASIPDELDVTEKSIKFTKPASGGANPADYQFYYVPSDVLFWTANKTYTLSFWAKADADGAVLAAGIRENGGSNTIYADNNLRLTKGWHKYKVVIASSISSANGFRLPWFGVGLTSAAASVWVADVKFEAGATSSPSLQYIERNLANKVDTSTAQTIGGAKTFSSDVHVSGRLVRTASVPPASASAPGTPGQIEWDSNYIYICVAANSWKRVALSSW